MVLSLEKMADDIDVEAMLEDVLEKKEEEKKEKIDNGKSDDRERSRKKSRDRKRSRSRKRSRFESQNLNPKFQIFHFRLENFENDKYCF